ncbi:unnamed protein product, partial [Symbiodinium natans]
MAAAVRPQLTGLLPPAAHVVQPSARQRHAWNHSSVRGPRGLRLHGGKVGFASFLAASRLLPRRGAALHAAGQETGTWECSPLPVGAPPPRGLVFAQTFALDDVDDEELYDGVLQFVAEHAVDRESVRVRKARDGEGLTTEPGLGWHEVLWRGNEGKDALHILFMERWTGADVRRRLVLATPQARPPAEILEFFEECRPLARQKRPDPAQEAHGAIVRLVKEAAGQSPKFWVQELVEAAIREEEDAERQSQANWSELDKEEADEKGA